MRDPVVEFQNYNRAFARRNPDLLRLKVARMSESPFAFFRGTFHLYAYDLLNKVCSVAGPEVGTEAELELVGDLHTENFGTYKAADGTIVYDVNDFDETTRGRLDLDVRRLTTSLLLASQERGDRMTDAIPVALAFLNTYTEQVHRILKKGKTPDFTVSTQRPSGCQPIDQVLAEAEAVKRPAFIERLTEAAVRGRRLRRTLRYFNLTEEEKAQALRLLEDYRKRQEDPGPADFFQVEDTCGRVSGIGSMGRLRYVVLLNGKGSAEARNVLLEFKEARPSAYDLGRNRETGPEALPGRAEKVIAMQRLSAAATNRYLGFALDGGLSFQVRELGPADARLETKGLHGPKELEVVAQVLAGIVARIHGRSAARAVGVTNPLAELNDPSGFVQRTLAFGLGYADLVRRDWQRFVGHRTDLEQCESWAAAG